MPMQTYKKRTADALAQREESMPESPLSGGMPSLVDGASRKDLPEAMKTKMENAFGADFSNLHIYESEKVAEGGAKAVTQGNTIAFAPGEFNLYSPTSEALLGHELSHVVSQARGESRGSGLVDNSYLEAKADREGVMAAAGQQVYSGPVTPLSPSSPTSVAGPMQCKKSSEEKRQETLNKNRVDNLFKLNFVSDNPVNQGSREEDAINTTRETENAYMSRLGNKDGANKAMLKKKVALAKKLNKLRSGNSKKFGDDRANLESYFSEEAMDFRTMNSMESRIIGGMDDENKGVYQNYRGDLSKKDLSALENAEKFLNWETGYKPKDSQWGKNLDTNKKSHHQNAEKKYENMAKGRTLNLTSELVYSQKPYVNLPEQSGELLEEDNMSVISGDAAMNMLEQYLKEQEEKRRNQF